MDDPRATSHNVRTRQPSSNQEQTAKLLRRMISNTEPERAESGRREGQRQAHTVNWAVAPPCGLLCSGVMLTTDGGVLSACKGHDFQSRTRIASHDAVRLYQQVDRPKQQQQQTTAAGASRPAKPQVHVRQKPEVSNSKPAGSNEGSSTLTAEAGPCAQHARRGRIAVQYVVGVRVAGRALVRAGVACEQINDVCEQEGIQLPGMHGGITAAEIDKRVGHRSAEIQSTGNTIYDSKMTHRWRTPCNYSSSRRCRAGTARARSSSGRPCCENAAKHTALIRHQLGTL